MLILDIKTNKEFANDFKEDYSDSIKKEKEKILINLQKFILNIRKTIKVKIFKTHRKQSNIFVVNKVDNKVKLIFDNYFSDSKIDKLIIMEPREQKEFIQNFSNDYFIKHDKTIRFIMDKLLKILFVEKGYDKLSSSEKKKFYNYHKIKTCIYCNRNYIFNLDSNGHVKGQLDHFYPKDLYPFFAMSYYNLIPCCSTCNFIKGTFDTFSTNSINPYLRPDHKLFETAPISNMKYEFKPFNEELLTKLQIRNIYNEGHIDIVNDLYKKFFHKNSKKYFNGLKKVHKELELKEEDFYRFITNSYKEEKEFHKRSFSKMTYDLIQEEFEKFY
jgi:hypothetical protein